jgi:hypothetical protein
MPATTSANMMREGSNSVGSLALCNAQHHTSLLQSLTESLSHRPILVRHLRIDGVDNIFDRNGHSDS